MEKTLHPILKHYMDVTAQSQDPVARAKAEAHQRRFGKFTKTIWVTKEGERIKVKDMGDRHLCNTIRLIERHAIACLEKRQREYLNMPAPTADGASMAFEAEFDRVMDADWTDVLPPIYHTMQKERERRGLPDPSYTEKEVAECMLILTADALKR